MLRHNSGDKIVVATDRSGHGIYFSVRDNDDNGTIIDFVQNRSNLNLSGVRKELRPHLAKSDRSLIEDVAKPIPINRDKISLIKKFSGFSAPTNNSYLASRGIGKSTFDGDRFTNRIATDSQDHVIFPHYDRDGLTGYSILNVNFTGFSRGGTKALWQSNQNEDDTRLVITARAIDALSYHQLFPHEQTRYISTEGTPSNYQKELIVEAMAELNNTGDEIIIATDNDEVGERLASTLVSLAPDSTQIMRHLPENAESWNEVLQRQIDFNRYLAQQSKQKSKQKKRSQLEL